MSYLEHKITTLKTKRSQIIGLSI